MSALATASLLLIAPGWAEALRRRHVPPGVAEALAVAAAANVLTAPVIAAISGRISVVAIPANLLAEPVVAVVTVLGFPAALVAPVYLPGGELLAQAGRLAVSLADRGGQLLRWTARGDPALARAAPSAACRCYSCCWCCSPCCAEPARAARWRRSSSSPYSSSYRGEPLSPAGRRAGWIFVACDVGQGDGLVLPAGDHRAVVIDSGPDPVAMDRCLSSLQITDVALLVFTHYHLDHVGGIVGVFHGRTRASGRHRPAGRAGRRGQPGALGAGSRIT